MATLQDRKWLRSLLWSGGLGVLWVILAIIRPETTFHLAPLLIAGAPPALYAIDTGRPQAGRVVALGASGIAISLLATALVAVTGSMDGPPFEGFSGPLPEAFILTTVGAVLGTAFGLFRSRTPS